jgi:RNA polymerase sigma-70 factor (ECF subfamily)
VSRLDTLLPAIVAGDSRAFGQWVAGAEARLRMSLASFAARLDVEALVQETLLRVWQTAGRVEIREAGGGESSLRYAIRIARNLAISELRRARLSATEAPALERMLEAAGPVPEAPPDPLLRTAIRDCVEKLPKRPRAVFDARLLACGGRSDVELAAGLEMKTNTFLQNYGRARKLLVECLGGQGIVLDAIGRMKP